MKILFGSINPLKIKSLEMALKNYYQNFEIVPIPVSSDVSDMPFDEEIKTGVDNRINNLKKYALENGVEADYYVALEGGVFSCFDHYFMTNLACIATDETVNYGMSGCFTIPSMYIDEVKAKTLGTVMDELFETKNTRYTGGAVGILTKGIIDRTLESKEAYVLALTKFINTKW